MSERRESSVLFSLKELRSIEQERIKQEEEVERSRLEAERLAEEQRLQKVRDEQERQMRDEQQRLAQIEAEKGRQEREEKLRLEEAERKARIEAQTKLEAARIQAEIHAKAHGKRPSVGLILGAVGGVVVLAAGALLYVFLVVIPKQQAEQAAKAELAQQKAIAAAVDDLKAKLSSEYDEKIKNATDEAERARLVAEKNRREAEQVAAIRSKSKPSGGSAKPSTKPKTDKPKCDPDKDPLCGSGL